MAYSRAIYDRAQEILEERRRKAELDAEERRRRFTQEEPLYAAQTAEMAHSAMETVRVIGMGSDAAAFVEGLKSRNLAARENIRLLLLSHGYAAEYLDTRYTCTLCNDTGFAGNRICACHLDIIKQLAFEEAGKKSPLAISRFSDFDLAYYPDEKIKGENSTMRAHMRGIFTYCVDYAEDFDRGADNLLLYGETGLGKTHLSLAIAGRVLERGYSVLYNAAQNIMNSLERERFGKSTDGEYEKLLLESDLLLIDDLGTEFVTQFTLSALYNIVNSRLLTGLPTIISTNLDLHGLEEKYTRRLASRLVGEYVLLPFAGRDIRQLKRREGE